MSVFTPSFSTQFIFFALGNLLLLLLLFHGSALHALLESVLLSAQLHFPSQMDMLLLAANISGFQGALVVPFLEE